MIVYLCDHEGNVLCESENLYNGLVALREAGKLSEFSRPRTHDVTRDALTDFWSEREEFFNALSLDHKNFDGWDLREVDFSGQTFENGSFVGTDFNNAKLKFVRFRGGDFRGARFLGAYLFRSNFEVRCYYNEANEWTKEYPLFGSDGSRPTSFYEVNALETTFGDSRNTDFTAIDFRFGNFEGSRFYGNFSGCNFNESNLTKCNFDGCTLVDTDFREAKVSGASFDGANLDNALLSGRQQKLKTLRLQSIVMRLQRENSTWADTKTELETQVQTLLGEIENLTKENLALKNKIENLMYL